MLQPEAGSRTSPEEPSRRRSRRVTHLCSDRMTHTKTSLARGQENEHDNFIRAEGAQAPCIQQTCCQPGVPWPRWRLPLPRANGKFPPRFGGSLLESKPGSLFESAEGFCASIGTSSGP